MNQKVFFVVQYERVIIMTVRNKKGMGTIFKTPSGTYRVELKFKDQYGNSQKFQQTVPTCILRSLADSDAFQSGRYAKHNGRPKTLNSIA